MGTSKAQSWEVDYENFLAPYAMRSGDSRGRRFPISPDPYRNEFQRDRDRIIHSAAFRKLEYKTQVYVIHEGDYYRTRMTHTLEVAQIARTLARRLGINEDLTEAIALSHDLGHTPFGHSGEAALNSILKDHGGFEHNRQSLRVVDHLEERYFEIPGLNLTWEVREGIAKHGSAERMDDEFLPRLQPTLEAQIAEVADEIAYNHHDIDDAFKMGLLQEEQLREVPWVWEIWEGEREKLSSEARPKYVKFRTIGRMMDLVVDDLIATSKEKIELAGIESVEGVRNYEGRIADFTPSMKSRLGLLKSFLMENVYQHPLVVRMQHKAERFVTQLFRLYQDDPRQLPLKYQARIDVDGLERVITDYISGMTDSYCLKEYSRAFEATPYGRMMNP